MAAVLTEDQVERFITDGFVHLPEAFPCSVAEECRAILWRQTRLDPDTSATWTRPLIKLAGYGDEPFQQAANTPRLHGAFDQLVGAGRWVPRDGLGTFPIRFPHPDDPGDTGWHIDGSYTPEGQHEYWLNLRSRGRALLMLFLFSDIDADNAPTRIVVGSHLDVSPFLESHGERGMNMFGLCKSMDAAGKLDSPDRPLGARHRPDRRRIPLPPVLDPRRTTPPRHHPQVHRPATTHAGRPPRPRSPQRRILPRRTRRPARAGATRPGRDRFIPAFRSLQATASYKAMRVGPFVSKGLASVSQDRWSRADTHRTDHDDS
jgi:hypothetical protein